MLAEFHDQKEKMIWSGVYFSTLPLIYKEVLKETTRSLSRFGAQFLYLITKLQCLQCFVR
jgi:hypothetical protein